MKRLFKRIAAAFLAAVCGIGMAAVSFADDIVTVSFTGTERYDYAYEVLSYMNKARSENGLSPLGMDSNLLENAMQRAAELAVVYSHDRPDGSSCFTILSGSFYSAAENIAMGYRSPQAVADGWLGSAGHRANILNPALNSIGIGCFIYNGKLCWAELFTSNSPDNVKQSADSLTVKRTARALRSNVPAEMLAGTGSSSPAPSTPPSTPSTPSGSEAADVDGNGKVNIADATALLKLITKGTKDKKYDVNGDGRVNIADATAILKLITDGR